MGDLLWAMVVGVLEKVTDRMIDSFVDPRDRFKQLLVVLLFIFLICGFLYGLLLIFPPT